MILLESIDLGTKRGHHHWNLGAVFNAWRPLSYMDLVFSLEPLSLLHDTIQIEYAI